MQHGQQNVKTRYSCFYVYVRIKYKNQLPYLLLMIRLLHIENLIQSFRMCGINIHVPLQHIT